MEAVVEDRRATLAQRQPGRVSAVREDVRTIDVRAARSLPVSSSAAGGMGAVAAGGVPLMRSQVASSLHAAPAAVAMPGLRLLGSGASHADELRHLLSRTPLFSGMGHGESRLLGAVMQVYEAEPGQTLIREGEPGDYMLLVMRGLVDVLRRDEHNFPRQIAVATPGQVLGEMSMVDGEPRFATCVVRETCRLAMLSRASLLTLMQREPVLGNKILLKLVSLLSERLRDSTAQLVNCLSGVRPLN
ncbi:MAG: cyclic nucleotide-binding domain-containing protein [Lautropia sp.]|nr:cyclic nucleotide-binding domain-containing protein [Lautropia sp.]